MRKLFAAAVLILLAVGPFGPLVAPIALANGLSQPLTDSLPENLTDGRVFAAESNDSQVKQCVAVEPSWE
ncbi:MAG: hypothetical protein WDN72_02555 [Alphaproteobacteria bacterium]